VTGGGLFAAVTAAGAVGAVARFTVDGAVRRRRPGPFPWGTLLINVTGSFLLGLLTGLVLFSGASTDWRTVVGTGFCGGFTTFSTASFECVRLAQDRRYRLAGAVLAGNLVLCVLAGAAGVALGGV
jgi:fluoride exporter